MKFFFDANLSPHLAHGVRELSSVTPGVQAVIHLTDRFSRNVPDLEWLGTLAGDGPWYIISIDRFKKQHGAEREAIRRAGHTFFRSGQPMVQAWFLDADRALRQMVAAACGVLRAGEWRRLPRAMAPYGSLEVSGHHMVSCPFQIARQSRRNMTPKSAPAL